jgi:nitrite reductase/ring-hydroxylating ferredoxin subunit
MTWRTIRIRSEIFNRRKCILAWVNGKPVLVARVDGSLYAMNAICNHLGCALLDDVDGPLTTCPAHEAEWDIRTGELVAQAKVKPEVKCEYGDLGIPLETYKVRQRDGLLEIDMD